MKADKTNKAIYGKFYQSADGELFGQTENSFSMGISRYRVVIFAIPKSRRDRQLGAAQFPFEAITDENERITFVRAFYIRLSRKDCPIKIDFSERMAMSARTMKRDKYIWRNLPFCNTEKVPETV